MSVVPSRLTRTAAVGLLTALVVAIGGPAAADGYEGFSEGPHTEVLQGSDSQDHATPAQPSSSGDGSNNAAPTSYGSSSPAAPPAPRPGRR